MTALDTETASRQARRCTIRVHGHLAARWLDWFEGMTFVYTTSGETIISGPIADQSALNGLLAKALDLNLALLSVEWMQSDGEAEALSR